MVFHRSGIGIICSIAIILLFTTACNTQREKSPAEKLMERIVPQYADDIIFEKITSPDGKDVFELESLPNGKIKISGNNYIAIAVGLNQYLKYYCKTSVSWFADQRVQLPEKMPLVPEKIKKEARVNRRFFLNHCTYAYTLPWWQWKDWERIIDWMALNGVNLPLAVNGQEAIWYEVWKDLGLSDEEIRSYFTGPAHLPFNRMSVLDYWQGPLPVSWMDHDLVLQKKILERERELGMKPVLQAFSGHVPEKLKELYPDARISKLGEWGGFERKYSSSFLDPLDPLFNKIQKAFLEKQTRVFGTDNLYAADPFVEVPPTSWKPDSLKIISENIFRSMTDVDKNAEWLQMSWAFFFLKEWSPERIKAFVNAVPQGKMTLLDYFCDYQEYWKKTGSFFGQPYFWCYLGNFGGNTMLAGNMDDINKRIDVAMKADNGTMSGVACVMEGLDVNPLMYEFVLEKAWENQDLDTDKWFEQWADRRCGISDNNNRKAWDILHQKIYSKMPRLSMGELTNGHPAFEGYGHPGWNSIMAMIKPDLAMPELLKAWKFMLQTEDKTRDTYRYDVVNLVRQILADHFIALRDTFTNNYRDKDLVSLRESGNKMIELLNDLDKLLATDGTFLLVKWIEDARALGSNEEEAGYYETNARTIITTWGGRGSALTDYANRNWAGLTGSYYAGRWKMFIEDVIASVEKGRTFDEDAFREKQFDFEWQWANGKENYSAEPVGNPVMVSEQLIKKNSSQIEEYYGM